ncbi:UNVERIFIED_CONTAM: hypothetical protein K2H54_026989 [Gekko kuhli]
MAQLAERLKLSDPRLLERPEQDASLEPDWLIQLRALHQQSEEEGSLPGATSTQPELVRNSGSIPGGLPDDLSSHRHQPSGGAQESGAVYHASSDPNSMENQNTLNTRHRSISESSTISMVDDTSQFSEDTVEEAISEEPEVEDAGEEQATASSFGWFRWFRSKPNKDTELTRKTPTTPLDSAAPVSQEKATLPPPSLPPMGGVRPPSHPHPPPHLPHAIGNPFSQSSLEKDFVSSGTSRNKYPLGAGNQEGTMFPGARNQDTSSEHHPDPDGGPLPPKEGSVPLYNPSQVTAAAVPGSGQPRLSFQRRYPPYPQ